METTSTTSELIGLIQRQPSNVNFLNQHRFRMVTLRIPHCIYFLQEINLPGISIASLVQPTPFTDLPTYGDKVTWEDLVISFAVDEDMKNYLEIWNWIVGLGFPHDFKQMADLTRSAQGRTSDMMLMILDSNYKPSRYVMIRGVFPVSISGLQFTSKDQQPNTLTASVTFKYAVYDWIDNELIVP